MKRPRQEPTTIYLKNGKKIQRVIRETEYTYYVIYNGRRISVGYCAGKWYAVYI